ncbi:hypothetical protein GCM10027186_41010 [Micromonospora schwarzwaldensis]
MERIQIRAESQASVNRTRIEQRRCHSGVEKNVAGAFGPLSALPVAATLGYCADRQMLIIIESST